MKRLLLRRLPPVLALALAACGFTEPVAEPGPGALTRTEFIDIYVELRRAERSMPAPEAFAARKQEIFERYGATPRALIEFVETHGEDVAYMAAVWEMIQDRLETVGRDTAAS